MVYFVNRYAPNSELYPKDPQKRAIVDRVLQFDLGTLYRALGDYLAPILSEGKTLKDLSPINEKKLKEALNLLDLSLSQHPYVAGDNLTLADLSILASLSFGEIFDFDISEYKKVTEWSNRLKTQLPYYDEINKEPIQMFKNYVKAKAMESNQKMNGGMNNGTN